MDPLTEAANAHLAALAQQAEAEALANQNAEISTNQNAENESNEVNGEENDDKPNVDNENPEDNKGKISPKCGNFMIFNHSDFTWNPFGESWGTELWFLSIFALFEGWNLPHYLFSEPLILQNCFHVKSEW